MSYESILHALQKATAALRGADVKAANQERPASIAPSAGRLVDLTAFLLTLELTSRSTAEDAPAAAEEGRQLASKLQDEYVADVNQYIVPVLDGWGLRAFKARWTKLAVMGKDPELYTKRAMFVLAVLEKLQSKNNVMRSIFTDGRVYASAKALADIAEAKTSEEQLQALSILRPVGHMANTRSWMKTAFTILDVETPEFEEVVSDVAIAQDLGAKLKNVEIAITNSDDQVSKEKLREERGIIVENIQGIAAQSVNPQAVLAAAATIAASVKHSHKSETGRLLMLSPEQEDAMMVRGKSIIAAGAGSGKCVTGDTIVTSTSGLRTIDSWSAGQTDSLVSIDVDNKAKVSVESATWLDMGTSEVLELVTDSGIKIKATPEHPLLVWDGAFSWKRLDAIVPGDTVLLLPGHAAECGTETVDPEYAYMLGLLMGDGWVDASQPRIGWSRSGDMLPQHFYALSEKFWNYTPKANPKIGTNSVTHWVHSREIVTRLEKEGMAQSGARTKHTPAWLMQSSRAERIRYLQGLFDTDATAGERGIEYSTASEVLARQVHQLLIGLGIVGQLKPKLVEGYDHTYWRILLSGDSARSFNDVVGFRYEFVKAEAADKVYEKESNPNVGVYPHVSSLLKQVREDWKDQQRWNGRAQSLLMDERWVTVKDYLLGNRRPSKAKLLSLAKGCSSDAATTLKELTKFYPDKVVSVVSAGQQRVYDFTVPATHSFIANSIVSHNTRVMAGKVVYHIRELGASPNQFIATSFSRKSSNGLIDRIREYGGAGIIEDGPSTEGMGTTHSIAGRFLSHYGRGSRNILNGSQPSALMKMAIDQVKMRPTMPTRMPAPGGFFGEPKAVGEDEGEVLEVKAPVLDPSSPQARATKALSKLKDMKKKVKEDEPSAWEKTALSAWERDAIEDMLTKMASGRLTNPSPKQLPFLNKGFKILEATSPVSAAVVSADNKSPRGPRTGGSRFWKEPANKWFNLGVGENGFLDDNKRAIGPKQVLLQVTKWKANLVTPEQAFNENQNVFAAAYGAYEWLKANAPEYSGWRDHDDTLVNACQLLVKNPKALAQLQSRYKYVFIDEAQDLNKAQHLMFGLIAGTYDPATQEPYPDGRLSADTYTLIGDDKQAIYEFRGATPDKFINMSELVPGGQNFTTKLLDTNYRSGRVIVDAANHLVSHNKKQIPMTCKAHEDRKGLGVITAKVTPNAEAAARLTAETVRDLTDGEGAQMSYKDFGVAVRTNAEAFSFCAEFLRLGIPFRSKVNFFNNPTTKALLNWMRLANSDPTDTSTINDVVLNSYGAPSFNLNNVFDDALQRKASGQNLNYLEYLESGGWKGIYEGDQAWRNAKYVKPYVEMLRAVKDMRGSPTEVLNFIMELRGPTIAQGKPGQSILESLVDETKKDPESTDLLAQESSGKFTDEDVRRLALAPVQPLVDVCSNFADLGPCMTYLAKLQRANEKNHKQDDPEAADYAEPAVVVDTVHGWKGLEVKHIFVPMAKGVFPHARSVGDEDALASERRLAYVAITRGQDNVTILCPMENHVGKPAGPSQFVSEACISIEKGRGDNGEEPVSASFADDDFYTEVFDATPWYLID